MGNWKVLLVIAVVLVLAVTTAYGVGRYESAGNVALVQERLEVASAAAAQSVGSCRTEVTVKSASIDALESRRALHQALMALDERNFGVAQERLAAAEGRLSAATGLGEEVRALATQIKDIRLVATEDVGEQRLHILAIVKRFDQLVPTSVH